MTGIQALEHKYPDKLPLPGQPAKIEFEYKMENVLSKYDVNIPQDKIKILNTLENEISALRKYYNDNKMLDIYLNFQENIKQKNGHIIYKVTGKYKNKYNFEIQIKSLFHNVWGEVEHKTIYKNQQYDFSNSIKKPITEEIFNLLKASNNQLNSIINFKYEKIELIKALFFEETHEKIFKQNNTHILGKHYTNFFSFLANEEDLINFVSKSLINEQVDRKVVTYKLDNSIEKLVQKIKYKYLSYDFEILKDIFDIIYILKNDIKEEKEVINNEEYAKEIPVIAYHFFYDPDKGEECNQVICHSKAQLTSHINYIKNNNFFTPTMQEFELYMEGNIRLPKKSVLITIDDGYMSKLAIQLLNENKVNATLFLITAAYDPQWYRSEYVELHSHTHNMHTQGQCPGGQGGGLKCLSKEKIASDLKKSSKILGNSTILCYPFYEFTEHTISVMKEVGYTMGFAGSGAGGTLKAKIGGNKYKIPRYTMNKNSTVDDLKKIIG